MKRWIPVFFRWKRVYTDIDNLKELQKENEELKEKLELTENDRDERKVKAEDLMKENNKLKEDLAECDDLWEELYFWKREAKRLWWKSNLMEEEKKRKDKLSCCS